MRRDEIIREIQSIEDKIKELQHTLQSFRQELDEVTTQEEERQHYISSKEILELIYEHTGKQGNMSMIKRWADDGYLGVVVDEKEKFWALPSKQGKKRFIYPKRDVFSFLYEKGFIKPKFEILDKVNSSVGGLGVIVHSYLKEDLFYHTIQLLNTGEVIKEIQEKELQSV